MGKRGPRKLPARIHERRGTKKKCRHAEPDVAAVSGVPAPPADLGDVARQAWNDIGKKLLAAGLITELDELALRLLCESWELYELAKAETSVIGSLTSITEKGNVIQNPAIGIRNKAWAQIVKLCQEFGLTPSSRTGLNAETKPPEDESLAILRGLKIVS